MAPEAGDVYCGFVREWNGLSRPANIVVIHDGNEAGFTSTGERNVEKLVEGGVCRKGDFFLLSIEGDIKKGEYSYARDPNRSTQNLAGQIFAYDRDREAAREFARGLQLVVSLASTFARDSSYDERNSENARR